MENVGSNTTTASKARKIFIFYITIISKNASSILMKALSFVYMKHLRLTLTTRLGKTRCPKLAKPTTITGTTESAFIFNASLFMAKKPSSPLDTPLLKAGFTLLLMTVSLSSQAIDFGPNGEFSLTGFGEVTTTLQSNYCLNCQVGTPNTASRQVQSSDPIIPGRNYGDAVLTNWQIQPYLGYKHDLGGGYQLDALLSQRWRQGTVNGQNDAAEVRYGGTVDIPGYWYQKNIALTHEDYGSVRIGSMTTRSWSVADYPYASQLGMSDEWASTGAGYGMLENAIRLGSPLLDVAGGDLHLEVTYDQGDTNFTRLRPIFFELYGQYHRGELVIDAVLQDAKNGGAGSWGHAPFSSVSISQTDDYTPVSVGAAGTPDGTV
jgi:hypothetical protein